jgi:hypothetical protein
LTLVARVDHRLLIGAVATRHHRAIVIPRHIRSTVLISSRAALQAAGRFEAYEAHFSPAQRTELTHAIAGTWLPFELAFAHYSACEALALPESEQIRMGRKTGDRVNGTLLGTIARLARSAGVTPWTLIEQLPRFWSRGFDGGEVQQVRLGPKEARITIAEQPLLRFRYFRYGLAGTAEMQLSPFCTRAFVRVEGFDARSFATAYRYQWA